MKFRDMVKKQLFILLVCALAAALVFCIVDTAMSGRLIWYLTDSDERPETPNVILVVVDALRADHLTQYGYKRKTSVGLEPFARQATRFENVFAPSSWTTPSTTSILTGLHPARHKATFKGATLNPKIRTLAEILRQGGYDTAGFSYNINITDKTNHHQGFDHFVAPKHHGRSATTYPDISEMIDEVEDWVDYHGRQRPFFLYMQPMNCHGPYRVPKAHQSDLLGRRPTGDFRYYGKLMAGIMLKGKNEDRKKVKKPYLESLREQYDTAIRYTTDQLSILFEWLREESMFENAMVIVTADHGEELFDHGGFSHGYSLHNEVVRVPMFVKLPHQKRSAVRRELISVMDIYPSVAEAMDIRYRHLVDGTSFLPVLKNVDEDGRVDIDGPARLDGRRKLLFNLDWPGRGVMTALVESRYKLIDIVSDYTGRENARLLYDRGDDPGEKKNIAEKEKNLIDQLRKVFKTEWQAYSDTAFDAPKSALGEMDEKQLKALGYVQ